MSLLIETSFWVNEKTKMRFSWVIIRRDVYYINKTIERVVFGEDWVIGEEREFIF